MDLPNGQDPENPRRRSPGIDQLESVLKGQTITLSNAIRIALMINRSLAQSYANLYVAQGRTAEAYSALNPTVGAIVTGVRLNEEQTTTSLLSADPTTLASPIGKKVAVQNIQQQTVTLGAVLPLDISGSLAAAAKQEKYLQMVYSLDVGRTTNDVVASVKSAFYNVLRARALRTVAEDDLKNANIRYTDAQNKYAAQVVTKFDVLRAHVDVANAEQQLISARNTVESLYAALNDAIGIMISTRLHASDEGAVQQPATPPASANGSVVPPPPESQGGAAPAQASPTVKAAIQNFGPGICERFERSPHKTA